MVVTRIHDGLWRWAVPGADGEDRASVYLEHGRSMLLVDPVLPPAGEDRLRFERAIAHDVTRLGGPVYVMVTCARCPRDADSLIAMTGGVSWQPRDDAPPGIQVIAVGEDVALWSAEHGALMPGRAGIAPDGPLAALPAAVVIPSRGPMTLR
ncbi:MAG: hypothetical protein EXQ74_04815 [Thermoleophilia bacterium]|nr:hypothetical protein [Thermoleophilia bacterium]